MGETKQQKKEREHQEDLRRLRDFRPIDDDFMRCLFKDNIPLAELGAADYYRQAGFGDYRLPDTEGYETACRGKDNLLGCVWDGCGGQKI